MTDALTLKSIADRLAVIEQAIRMQVREVIDMDDCAVLTGYSKQHLYRLTSSHAIPHYRRGGKVFFRKTEIEDWLTSVRIKTNDEIEKEAINHIKGFKI